jgi:hypothetical protein
MKSLNLFFTLPVTSNHSVLPICFESWPHDLVTTASSQVSEFNGALPHYLGLSSVHEFQLSSYQPFEFLAIRRSSLA